MITQRVQYRKQCRIRAREAYRDQDVDLAKRSHRTPLSSSTIAETFEDQILLEAVLEEHHIRFRIPKSILSEVKVHRQCRLVFLLLVSYQS
jgi:hypothetical protein